MIVAHEYMHIILGHCDTICAERAFLWENDDGEEEPAGTLDVIDLQAIEMFADEFSAIDAAWQIMMKEDVESIQYELLNYYLAVLLVFSIFHNYSGNDLTHPKLGIRLHSIIATVDDTIEKLQEVGLNQQSSEKLLSLLTKEKNIICDDETYQMEPYKEKSDGKMLGFMFMEYNYFINIRVGTVFLLSVLIDNSIGLPITSGYLAVRGMNRLVEKIDENTGVKCILLEILRSPNKMGKVNILSDFCGECCNNNLKCCFQSENKCLCTIEKVENIMEQLVAIGILKKEGETYRYDPLGII